jgi:hypothetical protein
MQSEAEEFLLSSKKILLLRRKIEWIQASSIEPKSAKLRKKKDLPAVLEWWFAGFRVVVLGQWQRWHASATLQKCATKMNIYVL